MKRTVNKLELPHDFADQLLNCEIEYKLNNKPSKEIVKQLVELYSLGVEYYQSIRSHKYLYFQLKMNQVFMSASTISAISDEPSSDVDSPLKKKMKNGKEQQKIHALKIKQKQQKMFNQVIETTRESATVTTVKKIISQSDSKKVAQQEKMKKEIENQDIKLKDKLSKRKSRLLFSKSFTSADIVGETDTRDTLFPENIGAENRQSRLNKQGIEIKPIEVSFSNVINQNDSDEEDQQRKRKISTISNVQGKKAKSGIDLFKGIQNQ